MPRVHIHLQGGPGASKTSKLLGLLLIIVVLVCIMLLLLGLWIFLVIGIAAMVIVGLVRALLPWRRARKPVVETHAIIEAQATSLRDADNVGEGEGSSPPSLDRKS
jgi:hypothetical protein